MKRQTKQQKIKHSIDKLFDEPFVPVWKVRAQQAEYHLQLEKEAMGHSDMRDKLRIAAERSRLSISSRCSGSRYRNS